MVECCGAIHVLAGLKRTPDDACVLRMAMVDYAESF
jgi:hypothetical protein